MHICMCVFMDVWMYMWMHMEQVRASELFGGRTMHSTVCSVLKCVAMCCSVLSVSLGAVLCTTWYAVCCVCVLQRVAVCCSVLQCVFGCRAMHSTVCSVMQCAAVHQCDGSVSLCVAVCCSMSQCVAV